MSLPDEQFIQSLPMLRRAFSRLSQHDIHYLTDTLLRILEADASRTESPASEASLTREQVVAVWEQLAWLTRAPARG
jgi:phosphate uptake regulator